MKFRVQRVNNLSINRCMICSKRMYICHKKKSIFRLTQITNQGDFILSAPLFVCSNRCVNTAILQGE